MHNWDLTKFRKMPQKYWDDKRNQRSFMDQLAKKLNIVDQDGWYQITKKALLLHGGGGLVRKYSGSPALILRAIYPEYLQLPLTHSDLT